MMAPLVICSIVSMAIVLERFWALRTQQVMPADLIPEVYRLHRDGQIDHRTLRSLRIGSPLGAILASGVYRMTAETNSPNHLAYFGKDASKYEARSPITHVATSKVPLLLSLAEFDPIGLSVPTLELAAAVAARDGKAPQLFYQQHHNHVSTVLSFDTGDETFGREILDFIRTCLSAPKG